MITRLKKEEQVKSLSESIQKAKAGFLVDFQGLNVEQITKMRKELRSKGLADMKVCRNTLFKKALDSCPEIKEHLQSKLTNSNAFVFAFGEPSKVAKILSNYVEQTETLKLKTGFLEGKGIDLVDIKTLATLPSLEMLQAKFLSVLSAPLSKLLAVFSEAPQGLLQVMTAYKEEKEKQ